MLRRKLCRRRLAFEPLEARRLLTATPVVIDLLSVYTPAAATQVGGDAHMRALIQGSVDSMNQALINTGLSITVRLVDAEPIDYTSSGDVFTDRQRLETPNDGYMDGIFALRNQYGADVVSLVSDGSGGGNADLMTGISDPNNPNLAFSAIFADEMGPGFLTLAHELGHNLGAGHERNNPNPGENVVGPFPYSYGYRFSVNQPGVLQASFNDIMSYAYNNDIPLFQYANPYLSIDGVTTGLRPSDPNSADLYDTFLQTAPIVANYRPTVVADTTAPTATLFETNRVGSSLTFTVRYGDDSGIDLTTIGSGDITVSGPGGFVLPATFVSMDHPTVSGAFKFATYHVTLPATNPTTSSLSFNLLANVIKDINGNAAAAGAISQYVGYYAGSPVEASGQYASYQWAEPLSSNLTPGATFTEYGSLGPDDLAHYYSFTLTQSATVEVNLGGFSADCNLYITSDANHDDLDDDMILTPGNGGNTGTGTEDVALTLAAGTYYIHVDQPTPVQTGYVLTVRAGAVDTTPPTAVADTKDLTTSGAPYIDFAITYSDDFDFDGVSARFNAAVDIHAVNGNYTFYYYPDPNLNPYYYADGQNVTIYYRIIGPSGGYTSAYNDTYVLSVHDVGAGNPAPQDAAGNKLPLITLGSFKIDIGNADTTAPTASLSASAPIPGQSLWTFNVLYKDNGGLNINSLGNSNIRVTGPGSYNQLATFVSATPTTNIDGSYLATYAAPAPGGFWDSTDAGSYTISLQSNQVKDLTGNAATATSFPTIAFSSPNLTALTSPASVSFIGTAGNDILRLDSDTNFIYFTLNDSTLYYIAKSSVPRFVLSSAGGNDTFDLESGGLTGAVSPGAGNDTVNITAGSWQIDTDTAPTGTPNVSVNVSPGSSATLTSDQHLAALSINGGSVSLTPASPTTLSLSAPLSITGGGSLNLAKGRLVLNTTATPIATIRSYLQSAYHTGLWDGPGITSNAIAGHPHTGIGYIDGNNTNGAPTGSELLTYALQGDTTLKGTVGLSDYNTLAANFNKPGNWAQGDFDYNGVVDLADYNALATNFNKSIAVVGAATPAATVATPDVQIVTNNPTPAVAAIAASPSTPAASPATVSVGQPTPNPATPTITPATTPKPHLSPWRHIARQRRALAVPPKELKRHHK